jgi:hypothetical protein
MNYVTAVLVYIMKWVGIIAMLPFVLPAFLIVKLMGMDIMNLDGMGMEIIIMFAIAGALAIGTGFFALGYFL